MDIWTGSIALDSSSLPLKDLRLSTSSISTAPPSVISHLTKSLSACTLSLISLIDPTRIPLFLAAGPSLELTTTSPTTERYFRQLFLPKPPLSSSTCTEQSQISLLVRVSNPTPPIPGDWKITELAIYGAISQTSETPETTPPNSSPPVEDRNTLLSTSAIGGYRTIITVHALPLSSNHTFLNFLPKRGSSPSSFIIREDTPVFIAPNPQGIINPPVTKSGRKRGAQVIDSIVEKRKRARLRQQSLSLPPPPPLSLLSCKSLNRRPAFESRSSPIKQDDPFPSPILRTPAAFSTPGFPTPTTTIKQEPNKTLARIVVAGMKACGVKDYRIKSEDADGPGKEEYKNIYHHTLKAAVFALRNDDAGDVERARSVVDRLLKVFCPEEGGAQGKRRALVHDVQHLPLVADVL